MIMWIRTFFFFLGSEVKHYYAELGVSDYAQFYFIVPRLDFHNGLKYLSNDADTQALFQCFDSIDPKIDIYVEHASLNPWLF